jgi:hypothetical protein
MILWSWDSNWFGFPFPPILLLFVFFPPSSLLNVFQDVCIKIIYFVFLYLFLFFGGLSEVFSVQKSIRSITNELLFFFCFLFSFFFLSSSMFVPNDQ